MIGITSTLGTVVPREGYSGFPTYTGFLYSPFEFHATEKTF